MSDAKITTSEERNTDDPRLARLAGIDPRPELLDGPVDEVEGRLAAWFSERGEPAYRVEQVLDWVYRQRVDAWEAMTTLPKELRSELDRAVRFPSLELAEERVSEDGTRKLLWRLIDGEAIESVVIPTPRRDTFCVSSQAGCALACSFCATGKLGYRRNLTAGEIVDQVRRLLVLRGRDDVGANVVFMGMGEPLQNWSGLETALGVLIDARGLDIGARRITVSTVGVPDRIVALGEAFPQVRLAVSLHAALDDVRDAIVPLNRRYPVRQVLAACRLWTRETGKRLSFEVIHLPGVNDRPGDVAALKAALEGLPAKINLMRYNPIPGAPYRRPSVEETGEFAERIRAETGATVTVRRSRGLDIEGACGQLRLAREGAAPGAPS